MGVYSAEPTAATSGPGVNVYDLEGSSYGARGATAISPFRVAEGKMERFEGGDKWRIVLK